MPGAASGPELHRLAGRKTHRLIASRFPTIGVFDYAGSAEEAAELLLIEGATSDRQGDIAGRLGLIPPEDRIAGVATAHLVMAAFLYAAPTGGRFTGPALGAWYAALDLVTAIRETLYHHDRRFRLVDLARRPPVEMRELVSRPRALLVDIRSLEDPALYAPDSYAESQRFGEAQRAAGRDGILFRSVRSPGGECLVIYKPRLIPPVVQGAHFVYSWDADGTPRVEELRQVAL